MVVDLCRHIDEVERDPKALRDAVEHDACAEEIPPCKRVRAIALNVDYEAQKLELTYFTRGSALGEQEIGIKRTIDWSSKGSG